MNQAKNKSNNWLLVLAVVALAVAPLILLKNAEFGGADGKAQEAIQEIHPQYKPWFNPIIEIESSEVQSLLFAVQAAMGAGVIGYVIGLYKGRNESKIKQDLEVRSQELE
ncbi:energy-coupling factor ABC transporter substrate-binding protein [Calothrix sp. UHCC 0171]|uniref:energy-coupling factor ABC transporter substrate-binding protein n=1 Tax=Calothrix sp. UHCC 0171 TaxID=3110245 RepID=UPI002B1FA17C|nr:energy-coupling factor ABC transporter substrate-binding protein [Calothrix sp. UHCC 0171]MEA5573942.1 energy-coupling factor ABC transporter substrate-binding protein [Calothrix sp. UHCC 0171]